MIAFTGLTLKLKCLSTDTIFFNLLLPGFNYPVFIQSSSLKSLIFCSFKVQESLKLFHEFFHLEKLKVKENSTVSTRRQDADMVSVISQRK